MKKNALIFAPHLDDELLIGGGLLYALSISINWEPYVIFMTNGDYFEYEVNIRLKEAIKSCNTIGIDQNHIVFLGYGDQWCGNKHIYNTKNPMISKANKTHTYALEYKSDYSFEVNGIHNEYTRANIKNDIYNIIIDKMPNLCIAVDYDVHPDHRALSLLFEETMGDVLRKYKNYHPLILKKFAYEGVYNGIDDYYSIPHKRTICQNGKILSNPYLLWEKRVCFKVPQKCNTLFLSNNILYKAAKKYKSQQFKYIIPRTLNNDIVFWTRRTDNIALYANINVSSGNSQYLQDFKIMDTNNVLEKNSKLDASIWIPDSQDEKRTIEFSWNKAVYIDEIVFYESQFLSSHINSLKIKLDNATFLFDNIIHDGLVFTLKIEHLKTTTLIISILKYTGTNIGLNEIEIFQGKLALNSYELPCNIYKEKEIINKYILIKRCISAYTNFLYKLKLILIKIFPNKHYMKRKYIRLRSNIILLPFYWGVYICQRLKKKLKIKIEK